MRLECFPNRDLEFCPARRQMSAVSWTMASCQRAEACQPMVPAGEAFYPSSMLVTLPHARRALSAAALAGGSEPWLYPVSVRSPRSESSAGPCGMGVAKVCATVAGQCESTRWGRESATCGTRIGSNVDFCRQLAPVTGLTRRTCFQSLGTTEARA